MKTLFIAIKEINSHMSERRDKVQRNVLNAAEKTNQEFAIMYDILGRARKNMPTRKGKIVLKDSIFRFGSACLLAACKNKITIVPPI